MINLIKENLSLGGVQSKINTIIHVLNSITDGEYAGCHHCTECPNGKAIPPFTVKANGEQKEEWPKRGGDYWYINSLGEIKKEGHFIATDNDDNARLEFGNCYRSRAEAQDMADKIKCFVKQWK